MLAAAAQPLPICSPFLPRLSLRRHPPRTPIVAAAAAAAAKIRSHRHRPRPILPSREATADEDALGAAPVESEAGAVDAETGGGLKGSDVLRALQRAVAAKEEASPRGRKKKRRRPAERVDDDDDDDDHDSIDLGSIRPVEIRSDWGPRIEELERRVEELQERQYY